MAEIVRMPQLAAGGSEAAIQTWLVDVGDEVAAGQAIVEIETEKAVVEYEAESDGTLAGILVAAGDSAAVGAPIAVLAAHGESAADALRDAGAETSADSEPAPASASAPAAPPEVPETPEPAPATESSEDGLFEAPEPVSSEPSPSETTPDEAAGVPGDQSGRRLFASPLVRRLAKERGLDLSRIAGSGPNGRIVRRDLEGAVAAPAEASRQPETAAAPAAAASVATAPREGAAFEDIPHTGMRRAIARRLTESKSTVPHYYLVADCRVDELLALRSRINEQSDVKISVNDFVVKAVARAMQDVPDANAIWMDDVIRRFTGVDVAVAVAVPGGLLTPVVRGVERMPLSELSSEIRGLADRAREGRLKQHELEGGSFSVSNLGMYGTREFSAIINPPHAGILAVGAATPRPIVGEDGELAVGTVMTVTMSADHRVLDGALGAEWLSAFVRRIENPLSMLI